MVSELLFENLHGDLPVRFKNKISQCVEVILQYVPDVTEIYLFGSCARGEAKWDSDVDLAVITKEPFCDHTVRGYVMDTLDERSDEGVRADVIFRTPNMSDISPTFKKLFDTDKVLIWRCNYAEK